MKFRNQTDDTLWLPELGIRVDPGETTPDLSRKDAAGLVGQSEVWAAVGEDAKKTQARAVDKQQGDN